MLPLVSCSGTEPEPSRESSPDPKQLDVRLSDLPPRCRNWLAGTGESLQRVPSSERSPPALAELTEVVSAQQRRLATMLG